MTKNVLTKHNNVFLFSGFDRQRQQCGHGTTLRSRQVKTVSRSTVVDGAGNTFKDESSLHTPPPPTTTAPIPLSTAGPIPAARQGETVRAAICCNNTRPSVTSNTSTNAYTKLPTNGFTHTLSLAAQPTSRSVYARSGGNKLVCFSDMTG